MIDGVKTELCDQPDLNIEDAMGKGEGREWRERYS